MDQPRIVVSALIERINNGVKQVFVQTRHKPNSSGSYLDTLEIPAGGVNPYENVYDALKREVFEETGLKITRIIGHNSAEVLENRKGDMSLAFHPYICQQVLSTNGGLPWYGYVFRCEAEGEINMDTNEATNPQWLNLEELSSFLKKFPEKVFSLQFATLTKYLEEFTHQKSK